MRKYSGLMVSGAVMAACTVACATQDGDDAPVPGVAVVLDGTRYAPEEVSAAVAGRVLHYVAAGSDGALHAFDDETEASAFARVAAESAFGLPPPPPLPLPPLPQPPPPPAATFFEHDLFAGCQFSTAINLSKLSNITGKDGCRPGAWNDVVSSVNTNGRIVTLYQDDDFRGSSLILPPGPHPSLGVFGWNDRVSSIKIQ